jgi:hypothetical protein
MRGRTFRAGRALGRILTSRAGLAALIAFAALTMGAIPAARLLGAGF